MLRPNFAEALSNRGITLKELKRFEEALASYDRALTLRPDYAEAHNSLGVVLLQLGHLSQARAALEQAVELAPRKAKYRRDLGEITRFVAGHEHLAALEKLAADSVTLSVGDRIELHFALGKANEDVAPPSISTATRSNASRLRMTKPQRLESWIVSNQFSHAS